MGKWYRLKAVKVSSERPESLYCAITPLSQWNLKASGSGSAEN